MATQDFDELWNRYMWQYVTPAEYASAGWDKRVILADLIDLWRGGEDRLSDSERLDIANQIAAEFTRRGYPMTPAAKAVDRMRAVAKNVDRMRTALQEIADMAIGQTPPSVLLQWAKDTAAAALPAQQGEASAGVMTWAALLASGELESYMFGDGDDIDRELAEKTICQSCGGACEFIAMYAGDSYRAFARCKVCDAVREF